MRFRIKVHSGSSKEEIVQKSESSLEIWIKKKPIEGKANLEIMKVLKKFFGFPVRIVSGLTSREKIIEVENEI